MSLKDIRERMQTQERQLGPSKDTVLAVEQMRAHARRVLHEIYIDEITTINAAIENTVTKRILFPVGVLLGAALVTLKNGGILDREFTAMQAAILNMATSINVSPKDYVRIMSNRREIVLAFAVL